MSRLPTEQEWVKEINELIKNNYNGNNNKKIVEKINLNSFSNEKMDNNTNIKTYEITSPNNVKYTIQKNNGMYSELKKVETQNTGFNFLSRGGKKQKRSRRKMTKRRSTKRRATRRR